MKTKIRQPQPFTAAKRFSPLAAILPVIFILLVNALPPLIRAYFGHKAELEFFVFEIAVFGVVLSVGIPLVVHRTQAVRSLVGSGWVYRGLLALVAIAFAYPVIRILMVASRLNAIFA